MKTSNYNNCLQVIYRAEETPTKNTMTVVYRNPNNNK